MESEQELLEEFPKGTSEEITKEGTPERFPGGIEEAISEIISVGTHERILIDCLENYCCEF